ncbi:hypothetical protein ACHAW5_004392 [Stephanodiscus triporus]|uniref:Sulfotransferase domain-containing protein n=1 Tax=Stephanodiscus triporus TaxID=2934178 RepID=A0ABD3QHH7_9STRA
MPGESSTERQFSSPKLCTIVYVLGVEGSMHHGVTPVLRSLAKMQLDEYTGLPYDVKYANRELRSAIFGFSKNDRTIDNPTMVRHTMRRICPANGAHHVIVEDLSFPSGEADDPRTYRVHRQRWWYQSTMEQIAMSETALNHPTNLYAFYEAYSPYADIRFVVLHRPYIKTVASHMDYDGTVEQHSNVLRGYMLLLRRFLDSHPRTWTLVCVERMTSSFHGDNVESRDESRRRILSMLAEFLGWDHRTAEGCHDCYDGWEESGRDHVGELGEENMLVLLEHMRTLGGIWPPEVEGAILEQKCGL